MTRTRRKMSKNLTWRASEMLNHFDFEDIWLIKLIQANNEKKYQEQKSQIYLHCYIML
jgi:hypothetical protein